MSSTVSIAISLPQQRSLSDRPPRPIRPAPMLSTVDNRNGNGNGTDGPNSLCAVYLLQFIKSSKVTKVLKLMRLLRLSKIAKSSL